MAVNRREVRLKLIQIRKIFIILTIEFTNISNRRVKKECP